MQLADFDYPLPDRLIAAFPAAQRTASRLLCLDIDSGHIRHRIFKDLPSLLRQDDLLVFNDTRVLPARLYGHKQSGGRIEVLVERLLNESELLAQVRASKTPQVGSILVLGASGPRTVQVPPERQVLATVTGREGEFYRLHIEREEGLSQLLERIGHIPLPPYIRRRAQDSDKERYQTVYARVPGAVAAPTAGLHFDQALLNRLAARGIQSAFVTLHVGAGTFQPVRVENPAEHKMHSEYVEVPASVWEAIRNCRAKGGRVIAVGTTSVRSLEAAARHGMDNAFRGETDIFIYPGFAFQVVDALITNFHLPGSTLLMLVSALAGREKILDTYKVAVENDYRFFSYGDAMLLQHGS